MSWIFYALLAPAIWGAVNHIDKYIVTRYFKLTSSGPLVLFTSIAAGIASLIIFLFVKVSSISVPNALLIILAGMIFVLSYIPYILAMKEDEASVVAPLFQMIFVFAYLFGFLFLGEYLHLNQIIAGFLVIIGAIIISIDLSSSSLKLRSRTFFRMVLSSVLTALNITLFKVVALRSSFWVTAFWEYIGAFLIGIILVVFIKNYRKVFLSLWVNDGIPLIKWNVGNELLNLLARLSASFATLFVPIALVSILNGTQPFFIIFYAILIPIIWKSQIQEKFHGKYLLQKVLACTIMFVGVYLLLR